MEKVSSGNFHHHFDATYICNGFNQDRVHNMCILTSGLNPEAPSFATFFEQEEEHR